MVVPRCRRFDVRAPRTRRITGAGSSGYEWARNVPREKRLAFTVTPSMPGLAVGPGRFIFSFHIIDTTQF